MSNQQPSKSQRNETTTTTPAAKAPIIIDKKQDEERFVKKSTTTRAPLSRTLALKLSNDIKDSALLSSIQLFEDQRSNVVSPLQPPSPNHQSNLVGRNRTVIAVSKSLSGNSKSMSSLLFINTTGNFSYDGSATTTSTTPTDLIRSVGHHNRMAMPAARFKLTRSESIAGAENEDPEDELNVYSAQYTTNLKNEHVVAANIKHAVGRADQLTDDLLNRGGGNSESNSGLESSSLKTPLSAPISPLTDYNTYPQLSSVQPHSPTTPNTAKSLLSSFSSTSSNQTTNNGAASNEAVGSSGAGAANVSSPVSAASSSPYVASSSSSFNAAALLASAQRSASNARSTHSSSSVLKEFASAVSKSNADHHRQQQQQHPPPFNQTMSACEHENIEHTLLVKSNTENCGAAHKEKKYSKRFGIVTIGKNVAKKTFRKYPTFIAHHTPSHMTQQQQQQQATSPTPSPTSSSSTATNNNQQLPTSPSTSPLPPPSPQSQPPPQRRVHLHSNHVQHANTLTLTTSPSNSNRHSPKEKSSKTRKQFSTSSIMLSRNSTRKANKIDWTDNAKPGAHLWCDISNAQNYESCYLNDPDALEFHNLTNEDRCKFSSRALPKKKCIICKLVVHENCIDSLQSLVKCRVTFRESNNRKKSLKDANTNNQNVNLHHWLCYRYDEQYFENKCQACSRTFTNRFGLQPNRSIVSCSWCKASYHQKCFVQNQFCLECNFGEQNQLIVPPSWILKLANKNSFRSSILARSHGIRNSKRQHHTPITAASTIETTTPATGDGIGNSNESKPGAYANQSLDETTTSAANGQEEIWTPSNRDLLEATAAATSNAIANHRSSIRGSNRVFIVRPPNSTSAQNLSLKKPLLVLINPKSGGIMGSKLLRKFTWLLNARQVFDLTQNGGPKLPLYLYRNVPNLRLLVGGGDGSVGWVLSVIDQIKFLQSPPSVAVLPLGTGNDLARSLNWGGGYTDEPLSKILGKILDARTVKLDRWKISTRPNTDSAAVDRSLVTDNSDETVVSSFPNDVMNNYFSLGADAHVCLEFHERREANPHKFTSRWFNLLQYAEAGGKDQIKKTWRDLKDYIKLECDNKNYTDVIRSRGYHCLIFLNIPNYSSGTNPWGTSADANFQPQAMNDGRLEVIGCYTSTLAKFQLGGNGERICQAKYIKLTTYRNIPMQIDGEPARLAPSIIEIKQKNQALMLEHVKFNTDSPILGYHSNVHKNFQVKCILMEDYEDFRKETQILEKKAIHIGTICTHNLTDPLSKFRITIDLLIKNCANGFFTSKWSFLNGDEFYRVSDDSDECLIDIVSIDEVVYILDENTRNSNKSFKKSINLSDGDLLKLKEEEKPTSSNENISAIANGKVSDAEENNKVSQSNPLSNSHPNEAHLFKSSKSFVGLKFAQFKDSSKTLYNSVPSLHKLKK